MEVQLLSRALLNHYLLSQFNLTSNHKVVEYARFMNNPQNQQSPVTHPELGPTNTVSRPAGGSIPLKGEIPFGNSSFGNSSPILEDPRQIIAEQSKIHPFEEYIQKAAEAYQESKQK